MIFFPTISKLKFCINFLFIFLPLIANLQIIVTEMSPMPKRISNNAVSLAEINGVKYLYSFGGIDSTKLFSGISRSSFKYNINTDVWESLADLPDTLGKIASGASTVKNKIYIIGGYYVFANGNEISSNKVHIFDPATNNYLANGSPIPVAIDDQVQVVWRDSIIFVVTGWSNTTNVPNVQLYNPSLNVWSSGTNVPNTTIYKAFGATGTIVGDTIYYIGGAATGMNFPAQKTLRKGIIDPNNPTNITWTAPLLLENIYRGVATTDNENKMYFLGGSETSYNYNGIAYNGSGGVPLKTKYQHLNLNDLSTWLSDSILLPMDLRGIGEFSSTIKYLAGGMENNQSVSNKTLKIEFISSNLGLDKNEQNSFTFYPNPIENVLNIQNNSNSSISKVEFYDVFGKKINCIATNNSSFDISHFENGVYQVKVRTDRKFYVYKLIKQ